MEINPITIKTPREFTKKEKSDLIDSIVIEAGINKARFGYHNFNTGKFSLDYYLLVETEHRAGVWTLTLARHCKKENKMLGFIQCPIVGIETMHGAPAKGHTQIRFH